MSPLTITPAKEAPAIPADATVIGENQTHDKPWPFMKPGDCVEVLLESSDHRHKLLCSLRYYAKINKERAFSYTIKREGPDSLNKILTIWRVA